jgi:superkiller protein 3
MGILTNDDGLVDAALEEILALPIEQKNKLDPQRHVDYLLIQHHLAQVHIVRLHSSFILAFEGPFPERRFFFLVIYAEIFFSIQGDVKQAISIAQHSVYADPSSLRPRNRLASLNVQRGQNNEAFALLANEAFAASKFEVDVDAATAAFSIQAVAQAASSSLPGTEEDTEAGLLRDALRSAQRAIMMRPSEIRGWQTLAFVRSRMS